MTSPAAYNPRHAWSGLLTASARASDCHRPASSPSTVIGRLIDRLDTLAIGPVRVSNNPLQESLPTWLLFRMFFDTHLFSSRIYRISLMVCLSSLALFLNLKIVGEFGQPTEA